jgi:hypothetical protein
VVELTAKVTVPDPDPLARPCIEIQESLDEALHSHSALDEILTFTVPPLAPTDALPGCTA